jgi:hypothetical protein
MAWTTPRTWVSGEMLTSTLLNTQLRDNLNTLGPTIVGYVNSGGAVGAGTGFTASGSGGNYTVAFTTPFSNQPVIVAVPDTGVIFYVDSVAATGFQAHGRNTSAGAQATGFSFHAALVH